MKKTWMGLLAIAGICTGCGGSAVEERTAGAATAEERQATAAAAVAAPAYREVTLPAGTTLRLELASALASDTSKVEDVVRASLRQPVTLDGQTVVPAGVELLGSVVDVARAGRVQGRARIAYRFTSMTHDGERYDIRTAPVVHEAEATKSEDAKKIAIGAGAGAAVGALLGGGGAAKGAAIGAAGGTGVVLATRGDEVRLGPGANVTARLAAPLTIRVRQ